MAGSTLLGLQALVGRRFRFERKIVPAHKRVRVVLVARIGESVTCNVVEVDVPETIELVVVKELYDEPRGREDGE